MDAKSGVDNWANIGIFAPLMIYSALDKKPPKILKQATVVFAVGTIIHGIYNHLNKDKTNAPKI